MENKREKNKMKHGVFFRKIKRVGDTCGRKPHTLF
jgi:uncharacterized DUF497 family protein